MMDSKQREFESDIRNYWLCEGRDHETGAMLLDDLRNNPSHKITEAEFKWHLADAILNKRFTVGEYERLTDLDFETPEEVAGDLAQLWRQVFVSEPIELPARGA